MRAREFLFEATLGLATLKKYDIRPAKFVSLINQGFEFKTVDGKSVIFNKEINPGEILNKINSAQPRSSVVLPATVNGVENQMVNTSNVTKPSEMKGFGDTERKPYSIGDIGEALMAAALFARVKNKGAEVNQKNIEEAWNNSSWSGMEKSLALIGTNTTEINWGEPGNQPDSVTLEIKINKSGFESLNKMIQTGTIVPEVSATISSILSYINSRPEIINLINLIKSKKSKNLVKIVSDGISSSKLTVADLYVSIDNKKINLISLKTGRTQTLGQSSGIKVEGLNYFFMTTLGMKIPENFIEELNQVQSIADNKEKNIKGFSIIRKIYDEFIIPTLTEKMADETAANETSIVKKLASAAIIFGKGGSTEDVTLVKLSSNPKDIGYTVAKFSDSLYDAMSKLDLEVNFKTESPNTRTIQFYVRSEKKNIESLLVQIRSFYQSSGYVRNYYEYGNQLLALAKI